MHSSNTRQPPHFIKKMQFVVLSACVCVDKRINSREQKNKQFILPFIYLYLRLCVPSLALTYYSQNPITFVISVLHIFWRREKKIIRTLAVMINLYHFYGLQYRSAAVAFCTMHSMHTASRKAYMDEICSVVLRLESNCNE